MASNLTPSGPRSTAAAQAQGLYQQALSGLAARPEQALSMALSLPFCAVHCLCCDRQVHAGQPMSVIDAYVQRMCQEIGALARHIDGDGAAPGGRELLQLHLGGGSANVLSESNLVALLQRLRDHWRLPRDAELSVECDPRRVGWVQLELLRGLGFGEVLFGVHELDPQVQRAIGRLHSAALVDDACNLARSCGIEVINLDLTVGLPYQHAAGWQDTLMQVIGMAPGRVTLSRYEHRPWVAPGQCAIDAQTLPDAEETQDLVALAAEVLGGVGYRWVGSDLFVLEGDVLSQALDEGRLRRSLVGYTALPPMPLLGLGCGAVSDVNGCLVWSEPALPLWHELVASGRLPVARAWQADADAQRRRAAAEHLLCTQQLPAALLSDGLEAAYQALARHEADGSLRRLPDSLVVTAPGRSRLSQLCAELAALPGAAAPALSGAVVFPLQP